MRKSILTLSALLALGTLGCGRMRCAAGEQLGKPEEQMNVVIRELIAKLGAKGWKAREGAQKKLVAIGEAAEGELRKASKSKDQEIASRAKVILGKLAALPPGYRSARGRWRSAARFGGSPATESAVEAGLRWLARHQLPDGSWSHFDDNSKRIAHHGLTGAAVLAFLGAGHTHKSGKLRDNVRKGVRWIISKQGADGRIGKGLPDPEGEGDGWSHAVCGTALAEAYGMTGDAGIKAAAQKAVDASHKVFQTKFSGCSFKAGGKPDTRATAWFMVQMKIAKSVRLKVPRGVFPGAMAYVHKVTDKAGRCLGRQADPKPSPGATAGGVLCRLLMGAKRTDKEVVAGGEFLGANLPKAVKGEVKTVGFGDLLLKTMAGFQCGGDLWKNHNREMKKLLLVNQRKGGPVDGSNNDVDGSWDTTGNGSAGRTYSTAMGVLCLETYYRYRPVWGK